MEMLHADIDKIEESKREVLFEQAAAKLEAKLKILSYEEEKFIEEQFLFQITYDEKYR